MIICNYFVLSPLIFFIPSFFPCTCFHFLDRFIMFKYTIMLIIFIWMILAHTPPTSRVVLSPSPAPASMRQRAMAHLRLEFIRDIVRNMAGKKLVQKRADFDRHDMSDGLQSPDASARENADDHRSELK
jgi:hypothetical protein